MNKEKRDELFKKRAHLIEMLKEAYLLTCEIKEAFYKEQGGLSAKISFMDGEEGVFDKDLSHSYARASENFVKYRMISCMLKELEYHTEIF